MCLAVTVAVIAIALSISRRQKRGHIYLLIDVTQAKKGER